MKARIVIKVKQCILKYRVLKNELKIGGRTSIYSMDLPLHYGAAHVRHYSQSVDHMRNCQIALSGYKSNNLR